MPMLLAPPSDEARVLTADHTGTADQPSPSPRPHAVTQSAG